MRITLQQAGILLNRGDVVSIPTETVYGLAASLKHPSAISRIFSLKGRPANNPLIIHLASAEEIAAYTKELPYDFDRLSSAFWPGPMTLVVPVIPDMIPSSARADLPAAAFRVPSHTLTRELLGQTGPLVMPSANISGRPSSTCFHHVEEDFGVDFPVMDGGECAKGLESTILIFREEKWTIIRLGALAPEVFIPILGYRPEVMAKEEGKAPLCPGQLYRHYAPKARLILTEESMFEPGSVVIGFRDRSYPNGCRLLSLGSSSDPAFAAHHLYARLRQLDEEGISQAWVDVNFPNEGLWLTLKERLFKASM